MLKNVNIHGNKDVLFPLEGKPKRWWAQMSRFPRSPRVGHAYLGFHTAGWGATAGPRRCRGRRATASHWSTVWMSPLTYRDTHTHTHTETEPYYPPRHHHWVLPTFHQVVPRALQMPGLLIIVLLGHQAEGGHCPTRSSAHPQQSSTPQVDAKLKCQAISTSRCSASYTFNSRLASPFSTLTGPTFMRSLDVRTPHSPQCL